MRSLMLDELDQQEYFTTVIEDGHNGAFDLTTVSADAFLVVENAADYAAGYDPRGYVAPLVFAEQRA